MKETIIMQKNGKTVFTGTAKTAILKFNLSLSEKDIEKLIENGKESEEYCFDYPIKREETE